MYRDSPNCRNNAIAIRSTFTVIMMQKNKFTVDTPDLLGLALEYRCASGTAFTLASGNEIYCGAGEFRRDCPAGFACVVGANNEYAVCCEGAPARSNVDERRGQFHI